MIAVIGNVFLPEKMNPNGYPVSDPVELSRHKGDPWPTKADAPFLTHRSYFYEIDSGEVYFYDAQDDCWRDISGSVVSVGV